MVSFGGKIPGMKKLTSVAMAVALSTSLLVAPDAVAADGSSGSPTNSVRENKDNADAIPDGYEVPEPPTFGKAYTGSAPLSLFLAFAATAAVLGVIAQFPPIKAQLQRWDAEFQKRLEAFKQQGTN